ncbi:Uncharacterized protein HZ326_9605 [Fusarium oxysporum f. sp. albedinis]|nr:Uncharacterized protein HZ326_9605 [Fusarium oxysporum f. sp. albedinis]
MNFNVRGMPYNSVPAGVMNSWIHDGLLCLGLRLYQPSHHTVSVVALSRTPRHSLEELINCASSTAYFSNFSNSLAASW